MEVKKGDIVRIEYTGRLASNGAIFDTTSAEIAKTAGIFDPSSQYGPKLVVFGSNSMIPGLEEAIVASKPGQTQDFRIQPEKAFGKRNPDLMRVLSEKEFRKQQVRLEIGMVVSLDGALAKVKSITSGRVVVDYNHPLAGEIIAYSLKVVEIISVPKKKAEAILETMGLKDSKVVEKEGRLMVEIGKTADPKKTETAKKTIIALIPGAELAKV